MVENCLNWVGQVLASLLALSWGKISLGMRGLRMAFVIALGKHIAEARAGKKRECSDAA